MSNPVNLESEDYKTVSTKYFTDSVRKNGSTLGLKVMRDENDVSSVSINRCQKIILLVHQKIF